MEEAVLSSSAAVDISLEPRRSGRVSIPPDRYIGMVEELDGEDVLLFGSNEPTTYKVP